MLCATGVWANATTSPNNDRPIYVYHEVNIPANTTISADSLYIKPTGVLSVPSTSTLTVTDQLIFGIDKNGNAGQLNSNGSCTNVVTTAAKMIVRKALDNTWDFISFPFNVIEANIKIAGTNTTAVWGDLNQSGATVDFYAAQYDGSARANDLTPSPSSINSKYYVSISPHTFAAMRGYIITGGNIGADSLDFVAATGTQLTLCNGAYIPENSAITPGCNGGWCLVGTPYASAYNLYYASPYKSYYVAPTYTSVADGFDYKLNSFGAFFMQATASTAIDYDELGLTIFSQPVAPAPRFSNLQLQLSDAVRSDITEIRLDEAANSKYVLGEDALKVQTTSPNISLIYTNAEGACSGLSINTLPLNTQRVDLMIQNFKAGVYYIRIADREKLNNIKSVILVDKETGLKTDLINNESYSYEALVAGSTERFSVLLSTNSSTGVNQTDDNGIDVVVKGNKVTLNGLRGNAAVRLYDVVGKLMFLYSNLNDGKIFEVNIPGVYIIDVSTETQNTREKILIQDNN